jgi:uncharacterized C2H2 Zn-finger protein
LLGSTATLSRSVPHTELAYLSLPVSFSALSCLLKLLSHGATESEDRFDPLEVITAAEVLGIDMEDVQVGVKKGKKNIKESKERKNFDVLMESNLAENDLQKESRENFVQEENENKTCGMEGIENYPLKLEIQIKDGKIVCDICSKVFKTEAKYAKHKLYHKRIEIEKLKNPEKIVTCHICSKEFITNSRLNLHVTTHTGEKPFKCGRCDKTFSQKVNCERHQLLHTGVKAFVCEFCEKAFKRRGELKDHIVRMHNDC